MSGKIFNSGLFAIAIMITFVFISITTMRTTIAVAEEKSAYSYKKDVFTIMKEHCFSCHGSIESPALKKFKENKDMYVAKKLGPRMNTYANLMIFVNGAETGALMRRLDDGTNKKDKLPGNMFVNLGKSDDERKKNLSVIKDWIGGWTLKHKKDITKEELGRIIALEK